MSGFPKEKSFSDGLSGSASSAASVNWGLSAKTVRLVMKAAVRWFLRFSEDNINALPPARTDRSYLLYLHVPFCQTLCPYCSFHRFKMHEETARTYFRLLRREMELTADLGYNFDSAYFGGGTTSILPDELAKTIDHAKKLFDIKEVSSETDPNHINPKSLEYTAGRIDRLSVGIQTFNDKHLESIGRKAKFGSASEQFEKVSDILKHFPIVNVDMIYNFPSQTLAELQEDIRTVRELAPQQATFYPLMYAPFAGKQLREKLGENNYSNEALFFRTISEMMTDSYIQRTSWTYALKKKEFIDEYVVEHSEYVGLGSGAFSFLDGKLYANSFSLKEYAENVGADRSSAVKSVRFAPYAIKRYRMMVEMFGMNPYPAYRPFPEYTVLKMMGAINGYGENAALTPKGLFLLSVMMKCFYNGMDYIREVMRKDLTPDDERI